MLKQFFINKYFNKLTSDTFLKDDEEAIIGKAKDIIQNLKGQIEYAKNPENDIGEEDMEFIVNEANDLISEIDKKYHNKNDVIKIFMHPMAGFYVLQDKKSLLEDMKEYCQELEENYHGNKHNKC